MSLKQELWGKYLEVNGLQEKDAVLLQILCLEAELTEGDLLRIAHRAHSEDIAEEANQRLADMNKSDPAEMTEMLLELETDTMPITQIL